MAVNEIVGGVILLVVSVAIFVLSLMQHTHGQGLARAITRTGETGSIRVDKPRGQSLSGKSTLPRQPATPELMPSRSHGHSNEPPRTAPRSAGLPFSHFERPPAIQEKHQADGSNEASRPPTPPRPL